MFNVGRNIQEDQQESTQTLGKVTKTMDGHSSVRLHVAEYLYYKLI